MKKSGPRQFEAIQHFADIDIYDITGGPSLLTRCANNADDIAASEWKKYFDGFAQAGVGPDRGALPFRVWQIWQAMVGYLKDRDVLRLDRKSTRLNSSHLGISYAVFCLK